MPVDFRLHRYLRGNATSYISGNDNDGVFNDYIHGGHDIVTGSFGVADGSLCDLFSCIQ